MRWISLRQNDSGKHGGQYQSWAFRKNEEVRESEGMDRIQMMSRMETDTQSKEQGHGLQEVHEVRRGWGVGFWGQPAVPAQEAFA